MPNDIDLNGTTRQLVILTGPNMGGKSTYPPGGAHSVAGPDWVVRSREGRQGHLLSTASLPVSARRTTSPVPVHFYAEMQETATSCTRRRQSGLVVLDEIGRVNVYVRRFEHRLGGCRYPCPTQDAAEDALRDRITMSSPISRMRIPGS